MAPKRKSKPQPGSFRSRQTAKLNSAKTQKNPPVVQPRTGARRQLPPSSQGGNRVGNSSQPWGSQQKSGNEIRPVRVRVEQPQLPPARTAPPSRQLPGMQGPQPKPRPAQPGTSRSNGQSRAEAAKAKLEKAAEGTKSTNVRVGQPRRTASGRLVGGGNVAVAALQIANAVQDKLLTPEQLKVKRDNEISKDNIQFPRISANKPTSKTQNIPQPSKKDTASLTDKGGIFNVSPTGNVKAKTKPAEVKASSTPIRGSQQQTTTTRSSSNGTTPAKQKQSNNMDDNYAAWVKANRKLAEKVKPGQAGYDAIQKALGKSSGSNDSMKIDKPASKSGSSTTASSNTRFTADEEKRGSAAFNQDSVKRLPSKETAEQRRRRMARQGMA